MYVKPAPHPDHPEDTTKHRAVRIPHTLELLPKAGREVPDSRFWRRRLAHGDVVTAEAPPPAVQPEPDAPAQHSAPAPAAAATGEEH